MLQKFSIFSVVLELGAYYFLLFFMAPKVGNIFSKNCPVRGCAGLCTATAAAAGVCPRKYFRALLPRRRAGMLFPGMATSTVKNPSLSHSLEMFE